MANHQPSICNPRPVLTGALSRDWLLRIQRLWLRGVIRLRARGGLPRSRRGYVAVPIDTEGEEGEGAIALANSGDNLGTNGDEKGDAEMTMEAALLEQERARAWFSEWEPVIVDSIKTFAAHLLGVLEPICKEAMERFGVLYETFQRVQLKLVLLRRWHIPYTVASWLARNWPKRWLPSLQPELWVWDEKETVTQIRTHSEFRG